MDTTGTIDELRSELAAIRETLTRLEGTSDTILEQATAAAENTEELAARSRFIFSLVLSVVCVGGVYIDSAIDASRTAICGSIQSFPFKPGFCQQQPQPAATAPTTQLIALRKAIVQQESGGDASLTNSLSGAAGLSQIMPENLASWSKSALGKEITMQEYMSNPDIQLQITDHKLAEYLNTAKGKTNDEAEQIKLVACWWYSGPGGNCGSTRQEAGGHPSISSYANEVLERYRSIPQSVTAPTATGQWKNPAPGAELTYWQAIRTIDPVTRQPTNYCHNGLDLAAPVGTPILAADSGTVAYAGWHEGGYGNLVILKHSNGLYSLYGHNESLQVAAGQTIEAGQAIALMGSTGHSSGPHLHWTVFDANGNSQPVNALPDKWGVKSYGKGSPPQDCSRVTNTIALVK